MNKEEQTRTSNDFHGLTQNFEPPHRANMNVLKKGLLAQKRKDRFKRTIIFSTVVVSLSALTMLTY